MRKKTKWVLIKIALSICMVGMVSQTQILNSIIPEIKYLGQAYLTIGVTLFGGAVTSMIDFTRYKIPYIKRINIFFYIVLSVTVIITSGIWFYKYLGNDVAGGIATSIIGVAISAMYECANQFDEKKNYID